MLNRLAGVSAIQVPYKGLGPALSGLVAGQIDYMFADGAAYPQIFSGKLRLLAVGGTERLALFPDTPTLIEAGIAGFNYESAHALVAPAGTHKDIVARLHRETVRALRTPEIGERIRTTVGDVIANTPEEFAANLRSDYQRIGRLIQEMGIRGD